MTSILIVDDSRVTREVTKVYLIAKGVNILEARQGEDALKIVKSSKPDLIIADMQMPKLDGIAMCQALQADQQLSEIPVIILTSNVDPLCRERCLNAGAREVLNKPVQPGDLIASIRRYLGSRSPYG